MVKIPRGKNCLTLKQWDDATTAQRGKWINEGRCLTMAAGRALYRRVKQGQNILKQQKKK